MTRTVDVHNSFYPKEWLDYLEKRKKSPRAIRTGPTSLLLCVVDDYAGAHVDKPGHYDPEARIRDMDSAGIDTQMLGSSIPSVELLEAKEGVIWAKRMNDLFAEVCKKYPGRFYAHITLPYQDVDASLEEIDRCKKLGFKGIMMFSNLNGKPIASPEFHPIYAKAEEYGLPIFVHPASPPRTQAIMEEHKVAAALYGYTLDTTLAIMGLIWQGVLEKYPNLKLVHAHLGGVVPYTAGRLEVCWPAFAKELGLKLSKKPSEYYQKQVYVDTVSGYLPAMKCCLEFMGADHMCLGTDYAHRIGYVEDAVGIVKRMGLSKRDTDKILGENAARIYNLDKVNVVTRKIKNL